MGLASFIVGNLESKGDSWSDKGMGVLTESKATPDGSIALRVMRAV